MMNMHRVFMTLMSLESAFRALRDGSKIKKNMTHNHRVEGDQLICRHSTGKRHREPGSVLLGSKDYQRIRNLSFPMN